jgi:mono/diheme cytochrome c family protein
VTHIPSPQANRESRHHRRSRAFHLLLAAMTASVVWLAAACGDDGSTIEFTPVAQDGQRLYVNSGCAGCHGRAGQGGVGPALAGISGIERPLIDGSTVIADEAYLIRAIMDPNVEIVAGYNLRMPSNRLTESEVRSVIAFILELEPSS